MRCATILARPPRYRSRHCKFPTCPTRSRLSRAVYSAIRGCISFILTFMLLPGFIVKRVIRSVFPRVSSSLAHRCSFFQDVFLSARAALGLPVLPFPASSAENAVCGRSCQLGVRRCLRQRSCSLARALSLSFLLAYCLRKASRSLQTTVEAVPRVSELST